MFKKTINKWNLFAWLSSGLCLLTIEGNDLRKFFSPYSLQHSQFSLLLFLLLQILVQKQFQMRQGWVTPKNLWLGSIETMVEFQFHKQILCFPSLARHFCWYPFVKEEDVKRQALKNWNNFNVKAPIPFQLSWRIKIRIWISNQYQWQWHILKKRNQCFSKKT